MKNLIILICIIIGLITSCGTKDKGIKKINLDEIILPAAKFALNNDSSEVHFLFCKSIPFKDWDMLIVTSPYANWEDIQYKNIKNSNEAKNIFNSNNLMEDRCMLFFLKKNEFVAYSIVNRFPIDFSLIKNNNGTSFLSKQSICDNLYLKKQSYKNKKWLYVNLR